MEIPEPEKEASNKENILYDIVNADILENLETVQPKKNRKRSSILKRTSQEVAGGKDDRRESRRSLKRKVSFASTFQVLEYQTGAKLIVTENDSGSENQPQKLLTPEELLVPVPIPEKVSVTELKSSITRISQSTDTVNLGSILKESSEDTKNTSQFFKNILNTEKLNVDILEKQILEPSAKKKKKPNLLPDSDSNKSNISVLSRQSLKEKTLENTLRNKFCLQTGETLVVSATEDLTSVFPTVEPQSPTCKDNDDKDRVAHSDRKGDLVIEGCMGDEIFNVSFLKTYDDDEEESNDAVKSNLPDHHEKPLSKPDLENQLTSSTSCYDIHMVKSSTDLNKFDSVFAEDSVNETEDDSLYVAKNIGKSQISKTILYDDPMDFTCKLFSSDKSGFKKKCSSFPRSEVSQSKTLLVNDPMDFTCKVFSNEHDKSSDPKRTFSSFKSEFAQNKTLLVSDPMDFTCKLHVTEKSSQFENPGSLDEDVVETGLSRLKVLEKLPEDSEECPDILTALLMQENRSRCETGKSFLLDDTMDFTCKFSSTRINRNSHVKTFQTDIDTSIPSCKVPDESGREDKDFVMLKKHTLNNKDDDLSVSSGLSRNNIEPDVKLTSSVMQKSKSQTQIGKTLLFDDTMNLTCKFPSSRSQRNSHVKDSNQLTVETTKTIVDASLLSCNVPDKSGSEDKDDNLAVSSGVSRKIVEPDVQRTTLAMQKSKSQTQVGNILLFNDTMDLTCKFPSSKSQRNCHVKDSSQLTVETTKMIVDASLLSCNVPDKSGSEDKADNLAVSSGVSRKIVEPNVKRTTSVMQKGKSQTQVGKTFLFDDTMDFTCKLPSSRSQRNFHIKDGNQFTAETTKKDIDTSILSCNVPDESGSKDKNFIIPEKHSLNNSDENLAENSVVLGKNIEPNVILTSSISQKSKSQIQVGKTLLFDDTVDFTCKFSSSRNQKNSRTKHCVLTVDATKADDDVSTSTFKIPEESNADDNIQNLTLKKNNVFDNCPKDSEDNVLLTKLAISEKIVNDTSMIAPVPKNEKSVVMSKTSLFNDSMDFTSKVPWAKSAEFLHMKVLKNSVNEAEEMSVNNDVIEVNHKENIFNSKTQEELRNKENAMTLNSTLMKPDVQVCHTMNDRDTTSIAEKILSGTNADTEIPLPDNKEQPILASRTLLYNDSMDFTCKVSLSKSDKSSHVQTLNNDGTKTDFDMQTLRSKTLESSNNKQDDDGISCLSVEKYIMHEHRSMDKENIPMTKNDIPAKIIEYSDTITSLPKNERPILMGKALLFNDSMDFTCRIPSIENARTSQAVNWELLNNNSVEMDHNVSAFAASDKTELLDRNPTNEDNIESATKNETAERTVEYVDMYHNENPVQADKTLMLDDSMNFTCKVPFAANAKKSHVEKSKSTNKSIIKTDYDMNLSSKKPESISAENKDISDFAYEKHVDDLALVGSENSVPINTNTLLEGLMEHTNIITNLSKKESCVVTSKTLLNNDSMDFTCKIPIERGDRNSSVEYCGSTSNITETNPDVNMGNVKGVLINDTLVISQANKSPIKETDVTRTGGEVLEKNFEYPSTLFMKNSAKALHISAATKRKSPVILDEQCSPPKMFELDPNSKCNSSSERKPSENVDFVDPDSDKTALSPVDMEVSCISRSSNSVELEVHSADFGHDYLGLKADKPKIGSECSVFGQGFSDNFQTKLSENSPEVFKTNETIPLYSVNGSPLCGRMSSMKQDPVMPIRSCDRTQLNHLDMEITYSANDYILNSSKLDFKSKELSFLESDMQETHCISNPCLRDKTMKEIEQSVKFSFAGMELTCNQLTRFQFEYSKSTSQLPNIDAFSVDAISPSSVEEDFCCDSKLPRQEPVVENSPILNNSDLNKNGLSFASGDALLPSPLSPSSIADADSVLKSNVDALECKKAQAHVESFENMSPIVVEKSKISTPQNISSTCVSQNTEKTDTSETESHSYDQDDEANLENEHIVYDADLQSVLNEKPMSELDVGLTDQNASTNSLAEAKMSENPFAFNPSNSETDKHVKNNVSAYNALQHEPDFQEYSDFKTPDLNQRKASRYTTSIRDACLTEHSSPQKAKVVNLKEMLSSKTHLHLETKKKFHLDSEEISHLPVLVSNNESVSSNPLQPPKSKPVDTFMPLASTSLRTSNNPVEGCINKCTRNIPQIDVLFKLKESKKIASQIPSSCSQVNEVSSDLAYNYVKASDVPKCTLSNIVEVRSGASSLEKDDIHTERPVVLNQHFTQHNQVPQSDIKMSNKQKVEHISAHCTDDRTKAEMDSVTETLQKHGMPSTLSSSLCCNNTINLPFEKKPTSRTFYSSINMSVKEHDVDYIRSPFRKSFKASDEACDSLQVLSDSVLQNGTFEVDSIFLEKSMKQKDDVTHDVNKTATHFSESDANTEKDMVHEVTVAQAYPPISSHLQSSILDTAVAQEKSAERCALGKSSPLKNPDNEALILNSPNILSEKESLKNEVCIIASSNITTCQDNKSFSATSLETAVAIEKSTDESAYSKPSPPEEDIESFVICTTSTSSERSPKNKAFNTSEFNIPTCHKNTPSATDSSGIIGAKSNSVDEDAFKKPSSPENRDIESFVPCSSNILSERSPKKEGFNTTVSIMPTYENLSLTSACMGTTATKEKSSDEHALKKLSPPENPDIEALVLNSSNIPCETESLKNKSFNTAGANIPTYHENISLASASLETPATKEKSADEYASKRSSSPKNPHEEDMETSVPCSSNSSNGRSPKHEAFNTVGSKIPAYLENVSSTSASVEMAVTKEKFADDCAFETPSSPENLNVEAFILNSPNILSAKESLKNEAFNTASSNIQTCHKNASTASASLETVAAKENFTDQFAFEKLSPLEKSDNFSFVLCSPNSMNEKSPNNEVCSTVNSSITTLLHNTSSISNSLEIVVAEEKCSDGYAFKKSSSSENSDIYSFIICSPNNLNETSPGNEACNVIGSNVTSCQEVTTLINSSKSAFENLTENTAGIALSCTNSDTPKLSTAYATGKHPMNYESNDDADEMNQLHEAADGNSYKKREICDSAIPKNESEAPLINESISLDSPETNRTKMLINNANMLQEYMMPPEVPESSANMLMGLIPDDYEIEAPKRRKSALSCGRRKSKSFGGPTSGADLHRLIPIDLPPEVRFKQFVKLAFHHTLTTVCRELQDEPGFDANSVMDTLSEHYDTIEQELEEKNLFVLATTKPPEVKQPEDIASEKFVEAISVLEKESAEWDRMLDLEKEKLEKCDTDLDLDSYDVDSDFEDLNCNDCADILARANALEQNMIKLTKKMFETVANIPVLISETNKTVIKDAETIVSECLSKDTSETPRTLLRNMRARR